MNTKAPEAISEVLAGRVRQLRKARSLSQAVLAERVGVSTEFISRIERRLTLPSVPTFVGLCLAMGVGPNELLDWGDELDAHAENVLTGVRAAPPGLRSDILRVAEALLRYPPAPRAEGE